MKFVTNGAWGGFSEGQELTDDKDIVKYFKAVMDEGGDSTKITDDEKFLAAIKQYDPGEKETIEDREIMICEGLEEAFPEASNAAQIERETAA